MIANCASRSADAAQVQIEYEVRRHAKRSGDPERRIDFPRVPLAVPDRQRVKGEPLRLRDGRGRVGIQAAAQEHNGPHLRSFTRRVRPRAR